MVYSCCDPPTYGNSGTQRWMRTRRKRVKMETTSVLGMNFHHTPGQENKGNSKKKLLTWHFLCQDKKNRDAD